MSLYTDLPPPAKKAKASTGRPVYHSPAFSPASLQSKLVKPSTFSNFVPKSVTLKKSLHPPSNTAALDSPRPVNDAERSRKLRQLQQSKKTASNEDSGVDLNIPGLETVVQGPDLGATSTSKRALLQKPTTVSRWRKSHEGSLPVQQEYNPRQPNDYFELTKARRAHNSSGSDSSSGHEADQSGSDSNDSGTSSQHDKQHTTTSSANATNYTLPIYPVMPRSRVVVLTNMALPGQVDSRLHPETHTECTKFGRVRNLLVYEIPGRCVRVFVKYESRDQAAKAMEIMNGRWFEGRQIEAFWFDEARFDKLDLGYRDGDTF